MTDEIEVAEPLVDESVESTSIVDESVDAGDTTIIIAAPESEPAPVAVEHCEHCEDHQSRLAVLEALATQPEPEPVTAEPEPEEPEPVAEETQPTREHPLNRRVFGGGE